MEIFTTGITFETLLDKAPKEFIAIITKCGSFVWMDNQSVFRYVDLVFRSFDWIKLPIGLELFVTCRIQRHKIRHLTSRTFPSRDPDKLFQSSIERHIDNRDLTVSTTKRQINRVVDFYHGPIYLINIHLIMIMFLNVLNKTHTLFCP